MSEYREGDRVRVTFVATVHSVTTRTVAFDRPDDGLAIFFRRDVEVKVLEPEYEPGAIYMDAEGGVYQRGVTGFWWSFGSTQAAYPMRPLRKLDIPEREA